MYYNFEKTYGQNLHLIHEGVAASEMTNKNIQYCRWDEELDEVKVFYNEELSIDDQAILAGIVDNV